METLALTEVVKFIDGSLPHSAWTHGAHLRVACWFVHSFGKWMALPLVRQGIVRLNDRHGTLNTESSGYHETLTVLYTRIIADWYKANNFHSYPQAAMRIEAELGDRALPLRYYSKERLFSVEARRGFVEPDLAPIAWPPSGETVAPAQTFATAVH